MGHGFSEAKIEWVRAYLSSVFCTCLPIGQNQSKNLNSWNLGKFGFELTS